MPLLWRSRLAWALASLIAVTTWATGPGSVSARAESTAPLPECRYDDILTARRAYDDWAVSVLDPIYRLPGGYVPPDLVAVDRAGLSGGGRVRRVALDDLRDMVAAARADGAPIAAVSAYRSKARQQALFSSYKRRYGFAAAALISARPGHSEHQLGTTIDFKSKGGPSPFYGDWGKTRAGKWMRHNAWRYGWLMSYPKGISPSVTCYRYEPWHYRYFGRHAARQIVESGLSPREWLWRQGYGEEVG